MTKKSVKKWISDKWLRIQNSKFFLFVIALAIGSSYTYCWMMWKFEIKHIFDSSSVVVHTVLQAEEAQASSGSDDVEEGDGTADLPATEEKTAIVTAYNSVPEQTDDTPCIGADGDNLCQYDGCAVASNDYPLGTRIELEGIGVCTVKDRMNRRYTGTGRIDLYMGMDVAGAKKFGKKELKIKVFK